MSGGSIRVKTVCGSEEVIRFNRDVSEHRLPGKGVVGDKNGDHIACVTVRVPREIDGDALKICKDLESLTSRSNWDGTRLSLDISAPVYKIGEPEEKIGSFFRKFI